MPSSAFPLVDAADIVRLVGRGAYDRGREYARRDAVLDLLWKVSPSVSAPVASPVTGEVVDITTLASTDLPTGATGALSSQVVGSSAVPYLCRVRLTRMSNGYWLPLSSTCTCPVQSNCKHVAASLLGGNAAHVRELGGDFAAPRAHLPADVGLGGAAGLRAVEGVEGGGGAGSFTCCRVQLCCCRCRRSRPRHGRRRIRRPRRRPIRLRRLR